MDVRLRFYLMGVSMGFAVGCAFSAGIFLLAQSH
jgi:hypothetical protein